jgi:hypothetical protein
MLTTAYTSLGELGVPATAQGNGEEAKEAAARAALESYFGGRRLLGLSRYERRDYRGPASNKARVGGALVIQCTLLADQTPEQHTIEINDLNRPLPEDVIESLAVGAPVVFRDYL